MSETENIEEIEETPAENDVDWVDDLDSDEISDILGFDLSSEEGNDRSGLRALINSALVSHRRLPMLDVVFDRAARLMTTNLRQLTNDNVEATLDDVSSTRFGDFMDALSSPSIIGVAKSGLLDNYCLVAVDAQLVYSIVDLLLGGRSGAVMPSEERSFTPIELALTERVVGYLVDALSTAFEPVADVDFTLDRIETTPRFAAIAQTASVCSLAKFRVEIEDRGGRIAVLTPHATLEPIYKLLLREFIGGTSSNEAAWREHLAAELSAARLDLNVVLAEREMTIGEIAELEPGQTIQFKASAKTHAIIKAGDMVLASGVVGKSGDSIAVRLTVNGADADFETGEAA